MYAIAIHDYDENGKKVTAYWTTTVALVDNTCPTHNYTYDRRDATLFADAGAAYALLHTLHMDCDEIVSLLDKEAHT